MSLNLSKIKRLIEEKISSNQQKEATQIVLLQDLAERFELKSLKDAKKELAKIIKERENMEEEFENKMDKLREKVSENGIIKE